MSSVYTVEEVLWVKTALIGPGSFGGAVVVVLVLVVLLVDVLDEDVVVVLAVQPAEPERVTCVVR